MKVIRTCAFCDTDFTRLENGLVFPASEGRGENAWLVGFYRTVFCDKCMGDLLALDADKAAGAPKDPDPDVQQLRYTDLQRTRDTLVESYKRGRRDALNEAGDALRDVARENASAGAARFVMRGPAGIYQDCATAVSQLAHKPPRTFR